LNTDWKIEQINLKLTSCLNTYRNILNNIQNQRKLEVLFIELLESLRWISSNLSTKFSLKDIESFLGKSLEKTVDSTSLNSALTPCVREIESLLNGDIDLAVLRSDLNSTRERAESRTQDLAVICDNIKSAQNLGNIVRTAECLGFKNVYTCGYTCELNHPSALKSSMGSELFIDWKPFNTTSECVESLKSNGFTIIGLETSSASATLEKIKSISKVSNKVALVLGNETHGISPGVLGLCDHIYTVPMFGHKNSLNVVNAFAAAGYLIFD
jgi:tRNA G18 (ribose-2'-O)-methylase SpoU